MLKTYRTVVSLLLLVLMAGCSLTDDARAQAVEPERLFERMTERVEQQEDDLIALRHDIHRHPELSGEEERTAGLVADWLEALGFEVRTGIGGHGVIGLLEGGHPGPLVAFRADMDAVRSSDEDPVAYRSVVPGIRHICGHDVHTAVGVGLAEGFAAVRADLAGSVMLIFQPAEETATGAKAMLADGAFASETPEALFAFHTAPFPIGTVSTIAGGMMAGRTSVNVTLRGSGDLDAAAAEVKAAMERAGTFSPEGIQAADFGFIMVQMLPMTAVGEDLVVRAQVMTAGLEDRARAKAAVLDALDTVDLPDVSVETEYDELFMEGVTNDAALVEVANAGVAALMPGVTVRTVGSVVPFFSEDFGSFQAVVPGMMYFLGVSNPEAGTVGMPHTPSYVADDAAIVLGTRVMLAAMLERLAQESGDS